MRTQLLFHEITSQPLLAQVGYMMPDISSDTMQSLRETNERRALTLGDVGHVSIFCIYVTLQVTICVGMRPGGLRDRRATR